MTAERRAELRGKYLKLGVGELVAAVVFGLLAVTLVMPRLAAPGDHAALVSALLPLLVVLVQAGLYWLLARTWVERTPMPPAVAGVYRAFRIADAVLLGAGLVGILIWWPERVGSTLLVMAVWLFAAVEYLNYFVVRLAYPSSRWFTTVGEWRTPRLVQDLRAAEPASGR